MLVADTQAHAQVATALGEYRKKLLAIQPDALDSEEELLQRRMAGAALLETRSSALFGGGSWSPWSTSGGTCHCLGGDGRCHCMQDPGYYRDATLMRYRMQHPRPRKL